jgi:DNA-binding NtrC family response regulator
VPSLVHVVDDDASFRAAIERRLKKAGYEVATYRSAQHFKAPSPNLIVPKDNRKADARSVSDVIQVAKLDNM